MRSLTWRSLTVVLLCSACSLIIEPTPESVLKGDAAGVSANAGVMSPGGVTSPAAGVIAGVGGSGGAGEAGAQGGGGVTGGGEGGSSAGAQGGRPVTCAVRIERCNQRDDDCDGLVDEDFDQLGAFCEVGVGSCRASGVFGCGDTETNVKCVAPEVSPSEELCDEYDNDCDGTIDEEVTGCCVEGAGRSCGISTGSCTIGEQTCVDGSWQACNGVSPQTETCDGADNDCDGLADEGLLNACGRCGLVPSESCDGEDNDCDGVTDEGETNACGECGDLPTEVCDGLDNDCDGSTDERVQNACGACGAVPNESCDGVDNDCDGRTDEGLTRDPCTEGVGACRETGIEECQAGTYRCNATPGLPQPEVCDGRDNDCDGEIDGPGLCAELCNGQDEDEDGLIDEGVLNACGECGEVPTESCDGDDNDCDGQTDEGLLNACGLCGPLPTEVCDGLDNDCDGQTDEGALNACGECGAPPEELCNGVDDDCDGEVDEAFPQLGLPCTRGVGECVRSGTNFCFNNLMVCSAVPGRSAAEGDCDNKDNDCDGRVDENIDFDNSSLDCGSCGITCAFASNTCVQGVCECGASGADCCEFSDMTCMTPVCVGDQCVSFCAAYPNVCGGGF